jgi:DNA-binding CsgD family transcriptional regulator
VFAFGAELDRAVAAARAQRTVSIVGVHGSGRSALLRNAVRTLEQTGTPVITVEADRASTQPGAAFLRFARQLGVRLVSDSDPLDQVSPAVRSSTVVAIDDTHLVDQRSLRLLEGLRKRTGIVFVFCELPGMGMHHPDRTITPAWPQTVIPMRGIGIGATSELVTEELGGEADPAVVSRIYAKTGGLPLLSRAVVTSAREHGRIVQHNGMWRQATASFWNDDLIPLIDGILADYEPDVCALVRSIAELGDVALDIASERFDPQLTQLACDYGLVRLTQTGLGAALQVWPRVFSDRYQRSSIPLSTIWKHESALLPADMTPEVEGASLASLSQLFREHERRAVTATFANWESAPTPATAGAYLTEALGVPQERERIVRVFAETAVELEDSSSSSFEFVLQQANWLAAEEQRETDCRDLLESYGKLHPEWRAAGSAAGRAISLMLGSGVETPRSEDDDETTGFVLLERAVRALALGRTDDARTLSRSAAPSRQVSKITCTTIEALADLIDSRPDAALAKAEGLMSQGEYHKLRGAYISGSYVAAMANYELGRRNAFLGVLNSVLLVGRPQYLFQGFYAALLQIHAIGQGRGGSASLRAALLRESERLQPRPGPFFGMGVDFATTVSVEQHSPILFDQHIAAAVRRRRELGYLVGAAHHGLYGLQYYFGPNTVQEFRRVVGRLQTPGFDQALQLVDLVQSGTTDGLASWADRVRTGHYNASTPRLLLSAARSEPEPHRRDVMENVARALGGDRIVTDWPAYSELGSPEQPATGPQLTQREREIALLAGRLTNSDIAERLSLSPRTVENHLARAMRKIGVSNRHELFEKTSMRSSTQ